MTNTEIDLYADETFHESHDILGICILFVPRSKSSILTKKIINSRCLHKKGSEWVSEYKKCLRAEECREEWHKNNDSEIHYKDIRNGSSYSIKSISKSWLSIIMQNTDSFMFNILYLDLKKLDLKYFGKDQSNVYNKFFRSTIKYGVKAFFPECNRVQIHNVYHDNSSALSRHGFFPSYNLSKLESEFSRLVIPNKEVVFVESDHKKYEDLEGKKNANLVQFTDLALGAVGQNIFYFSDDPFRKELAMEIRPMVEEILNGKYSQFKKKYHVSFFPKRELDKKMMETLRGETFSGGLGDEFYSPEIKMPRYYKDVATLDTWL